MWGVVCQLADGCSCLLSEQLTEFFKLCYRNESVGELLGSRMSQDSSLTGGWVCVGGGVVGQARLSM